MWFPSGRTPPPMQRYATYVGDRFAFMRGFRARGYLNLLRYGLSATLPGPILLEKVTQDVFGWLEDVVIRRIVIPADAILESPTSVFVMYYPVHRVLYEFGWMLVLIGMFIDGLRLVVGGCRGVVPGRYCWMAQVLFGVAHGFPWGALPETTVGASQRRLVGVC